MDCYSSYLKWIDTQKGPLLERVKSWSAINTYTYNTSGLAQLAEILASDFLILGGEMSRIKLSTHNRSKGDRSTHDLPLGDALIFRKRPSAPLQILLGGHYDTVFAPSNPFQKVEEQTNGVWKGPGVADMKGGLAILLTAVEALERAPFADSLGWEILVTPDEEIGSPGSAALYQAAASRHQAGLLFEPSFPDGAFVSERNGSATYSVLIRGRPAHVGRDFTQGRSAVFALARFIDRLARYQQGKELTINVADVEGPGPVNIVPPLATCRINVRSLQLDLLNEAETYMKQLAHETALDGIEIEIEQETFRPPKPFDLRTKGLFEAYGSCASALNLPFSYRPTGGVCDGNILAGAGLPTLDTAGAIGGALHTYDEYLIGSSLLERSKLAALFLLKLANGEIVIKQEAPHV